ncbi:MAG: glycosyl hydrolase family 28-related protein, partial [Bacteroidota bacterium]|nr:glycosyl hydrolase family 28-related protein [Bacteroidota bacterium]
MLPILRNRFRYLLLTVIAVGLVSVSCKKKDEQPKADLAQTENVWAQADAIIKEIGTVTFQDSVFNINEYGAVADGTTLNTEAFKAAIAACNQAGGGKVLVPKGTYLTGPIHLKSNVNLHLEADAEVLFTTDKGA